MASRSWSSAAGTLQRLPSGRNCRVGTGWGRSGDGVGTGWGRGGDGVGTESGRSRDGVGTESTRRFVTSPPPSALGSRCPVRDELNREPRITRMGADRSRRRSDLHAPGLKAAQRERLDGSASRPHQCTGATDGWRAPDPIGPSRRTEFRPPRGAIRLLRRIRRIRSPPQRPGRHPCAERRGRRAIRSHRSGTIRDRWFPTVRSTASAKSASWQRATRRFVVVHPSRATGLSVTPAEGRKHRIGGARREPLRSAPAAPRPAGARRLHRATHAAAAPSRPLPDRGAAAT